MIDNIVERHKEIQMSTCLFRYTDYLFQLINIVFICPQWFQKEAVISTPSTYRYFFSFCHVIIICLFFFLLILSFSHIQLEINIQLIVYNVVLSFQSFIKAKRFMVTHYPTPEDAVDFLRLLNDHESDTVICMDPIRQVESVRKNLLMLSFNKNSFVSYLLLSCFCCSFYHPLQLDSELVT